MIYSYSKKRIREAKGKKMSKGTGFGKTILIGDQFVLHEVPAIVAALPFETVATVELIEGVGWVLEDNRSEVPGYKERKKSNRSIPSTGFLTL